MMMRNGTNSLTTDVPSEREINRLAARSDEEFRLFEMMDEERRRKEGYRIRLMEEHEVPKWVYNNGTAAANDEHKEKGSYDVVESSDNVGGKRQRKEEVCTSKPPKKKRSSLTRALMSPVPQLLSANVAGLRFKLAWFSDLHQLGEVVF
ncbi:OLC1v1008335C1 [Oldenlandia corymbosa var. corymbosa]|uniref:OLC1v1008335C1 n=1 Tax=Oldenlandia corymbosa var. corymbosa TaxID=529605 RepID=A0AAV1DLQ2_OLDCO|nr:OLC1v1008335C1 [Oldenlandia corymbosa var. corymbosa]